MVFRSCTPITMVGLDVCHRTRFDRHMADAARSRGTTLATFIADSSEPWVEIMSATDGAAGLHLYDSLAVAAAIETDLCDYRRTLVEIETGTGPAQGMTVTHTNDVLRQLLVGRDPNADVAIDVDVDRFSTRFAERVLDRL